METFLMVSRLNYRSFYGYENMQSEGMVIYFWISSVFKCWLPHPHPLD